MNYCPHLNGLVREEFIIYAKIAFIECKKPLYIPKSEQS